MIVASLFSSNISKENDTKRNNLFQPRPQGDRIQGLGTLHHRSHGFFLKEGKTPGNEGYLENHTLSCSTNLYNCNA